MLNHTMNFLKLFLRYLLCTVLLASAIISLHGCGERASDIEYSDNNSKNKYTYTLIRRHELETVRQKIDLYMDKHRDSYANSYTVIVTFSVFNDSITKSVLKYTIDGHYFGGYDVLYPGETNKIGPEENKHYLFTVISDYDTSNSEEQNIQRRRLAVLIDKKTLAIVKISSFQWIKNPIEGGYIVVTYYEKDL